MADWYTISNVDDLDSPALVIYPERIRKNLEIAKSFVGDAARLRPHIKTNKCPNVVRLMMGEGISKFKCATIAEGEMLAIENAKDVLLAYQPTGPKARRYCELLKKYPQTVFSCLVDNEKCLGELSALATANSTTIRVFIDLNVGMNRTGIAPDNAAFSLCIKAKESEGIELVGLHAYDGHLRDADIDARKQKCDEAFKPVEELRRKVATLMEKDPVVVAGGTPSFPIHAKVSNRETSPGTFVFWDRGYQQSLTEQPFEIAAVVVTRVISVPAPNTVCTDLGHKSIASENPINKRVYFLNAPDLVPVGQSEEHLVLEAPADHRYKPGDVLYGIPHHICPTVALYEELAVSRGNEVAEYWPVTARKRKITV